MLLDSVMPPDLNVTAMDDGQATAGENTFHEFASWIARYDAVYHFGTTEPVVAKALARSSRATSYGATVNGMLANPRREWAGLAAAARGHSRRRRTARRRGENHAASAGTASRTRFNHFQQTALLCNESPSPRDFDTVWQHRVDRMKRLPVAGGYGLYEQLCVGWPLDARPWSFAERAQARCSSSATPTSRSRRSAGRSRCSEQIGGALMTIEDDVHGSLSSLPCADAAVTFFDTGQTTSESCPGAPIPARSRELRCEPAAARGPPSARSRAG